MQGATVHIIDDDPDMRDSLCWLLRTVRIDSIAYATAEEFLDAARPTGPSCLILDVRMPGTGGMDLFEELIARRIAIPVLFITAFADVPMAVRALKAGACEFIEKPFNGQVLLEKVQRALQEDARRLEREAEAEAIRSRLSLLTDKEREVLGMIRAGCVNKEIAQRLDLTPRAVELRRASLMKKLGVQSLPDLLRLTILYEEPGLGADRIAREGVPPRRG